MRSVLALTGGRKVPSARFRVRQYISELQQHNIALTEHAAWFGTYPPPTRWVRPIWACASLAQRVPSLVASYRYEVVLFQREMLSTFATLESLANKPRVFDVDDAIFLYRNGTFTKRLAREVNCVICGNEFLADWFSGFNANVVIIPTAVDTDRYVPGLRSLDPRPLTIGWIGSSANLEYLQRIEVALAKTLHATPRARLLVVCDKAPCLPALDQSRIEFVKWSEDLELHSIQRMDVGIMPLDDSLWARGKCSFKMLQYMSCGIPSVVSPVGSNIEILGIGACSLGAATESQWIENLTTLLMDSALRARMGQLARRIALEHFSVHALAPRLAACLHSVCT